MRHITKKQQKAQIELLEYIYELLSGGYSMKQALGFLETVVQTKSVYQQILNIFEEGRNFSEVIELFQYPHMIKTMICFGETSGMLKEAIRRSIQYLKITMELKEMILKQLQYPLVILSATLFFVLGFHTFLLPQIFSIQKMIGGAKESMSTKFVMVLLQSLPCSIIVFIGICSVSLGGFLYLYKRGDSRFFYLLLRIPFLKVIMKLWNQLQITMLTRVFFEQGYGVKRLFEEMQKSEYPCHIQSQARDIYIYLNQGYSYPDALKKCKIYTSDYINLIQRALANKTITVDLLFYERYGNKILEKEIKKWIHIILPILYIHVGLLIVLSYLAFIMPMMDMLGTI